MKEHHLIKKTRKLAADDPDYVYPGTRGCFYAATNSFNQPSCIFGEAFKLAGKTDDELSKHEGEDAPFAAKSLGFRIGEGDRFWMKRVQEHQDTGRTWSEAVLMADQAFGRA